MDRNEAIEVVKNNWPNGRCQLAEALETLIPELAESEDEKIRNTLIDLFKNRLTYYGTEKLKDLKVDDILAWLEKQSEKFQYWKPSEEQLEALDYVYNLCPNTERGNYYEGVLETLIDDLHKLSEKQDEQKPILDFKAKDWYVSKVDGKIHNIYHSVDKVEPKFKGGEWVIDKQGIVYQIANVIENVTNHTYGYDTVGGGYFNDNTEGVRLWTIKDAKKGDILQANNCTLIFDSLTKDMDGNTVISSWYYCDAETFYGMGIFGPDLWVIEDVVPATEEQRNFLFSKMEETGYKWDFEKKELKKIEQKLTEWSKQQVVNALTKWLTEEIASIRKKSLDGTLTERYEMFEAALLEMRSFVNSSDFQIGKDVPKDWSEEDERMLQQITQCLISLSEECEVDLNDKLNWLKSLKKELKGE